MWREFVKNVVTAIVPHDAPPVSRPIIMNSMLPAYTNPDSMGATHQGRPACTTTMPKPSAMAKNPAHTAPACRAAARNSGEPMHAIPRRRPGGVPRILIQGRPRPTLGVQQRRYGYNHRA